MIRDLPSADDPRPEVPLVPGIGRAVDLVVQNKTTGLRLDHYLAQQFPDFSRSLMQKAIEAGCVLLNDGTVKFIRSEEELHALRWK